MCVGGGCVPVWVKVRVGVRVRVWWWWCVVGVDGTRTEPAGLDAGQRARMQTEPRATDAVRACLAPAAEPGRRRAEKEQKGQATSSQKPAARTATDMGPSTLGGAVGVEVGVGVECERAMDSKTILAQPPSTPKIGETLL